MFNLTTDTLTEFPIPNLNDVNDITTGPDGDLWFTMDTEVRDARPGDGGMDDREARPEPAHYRDPATSRHLLLGGGLSDRHQNGP